LTLLKTLSVLAPLREITFRVLLLAHIASLSNLLHQHETD